MSRAVVFMGAGCPLEIGQFAVPEPRTGEVLVRVTCCTLCRSDLHTHAGRRTEPTPIVLGHEIVGQVEAFRADGARVDASGLPLRIGDRVSWAVAVGCGFVLLLRREELPQKCERPYKYGHQRLTPERPLGGDWPTMSYLCQEQPVSGFGRDPRPGGGVSQLWAGDSGGPVPVQRAGRRTNHPHPGRGHSRSDGMCDGSRPPGGAVVVSDPDPALRNRAYNFGATHALSADAEEIATAIRDVTQGRGADLVLELAGVEDAAVTTALASARTGGAVILAGTVAPIGSVGFDPEQVVRRMLSIRGVHNYHPRDLATARGVYRRSWPRLSLEEPCRRRIPVKPDRVGIHRGPYPAWHAHCRCPGSTDRQMTAISQPATSGRPR